MTAPNSSEPGRGEAINSIIFSATALEAFINERSEWAAQMCDFAPQPDAVVAFANVMQDAEKARASIQSKYQLARWVLTGQAYDQGANPYQDFAVLVDLRNSLLHLKPWPAVMKKLAGKNVLLAQNYDALESIIGGWTLLLHTREMATWAAHSAIQFIAEFLSSVQQPSARTVLPSKDDYFSDEQWLLTL